MKKKKPNDTYVLANLGHTAVILKLDPNNGIDVTQCPQDESVRAMRLAVACLNTGKSEKEIYAAIEGLTP